MNAVEQDTIQQKFRAFFTNKAGQYGLPGNVGGARDLRATCQAIMEDADPFMFQLLADWDERNLLKPRVGPPVTILDLGIHLVALGQWEGAWALGQLHYDQFRKEEVRTSQRRHKGHPACGLAIIARELGSPSLTRHYALLSSAGDIYREHEEPELRYGGYAPTMLEQFESRQQQETWRGQIRETLKQFTQSDPIHLEALLASLWLGSNREHVLNLATVSANGHLPFPELLLREVESQIAPPWLSAGTRFEAAVGLLLSSTPGFEVDSCRKTTDEQIDLVVRYQPDRLSDLGLESGFGLVECKSSQDAVSVSDLRDFGAKCLFHRVKFGILVARAGITGGTVAFKEPQHAELTRRRFQIDGLTVLVLDISQLRGKARELRGLLDELRADYRRLIFGPTP